MNFEGKAQSLLTFRVGPVLCCAPSLPVRSIITPPKLTHPPGSDSSQPGIFKHGSHIVKVLDLRQKFGIEKDQHVHPGNLIVTIFEEQGFAFWVDQILDVFDFPSEGWGDLPPAIPRGVFSRTLLLNKKIHLYSEFEKLATINDLGYLKHYIQQLTQKENHAESDNKIKPKHSTAINKTRIDTKIQNNSEEIVKTNTVPVIPLDKPTIEKKTAATTHTAIKNTPVSEVKVMSKKEQPGIKNKFHNKTPEINQPVLKSPITKERTSIITPKSSSASILPSSSETTIFSQKTNNPPRKPVKPNPLQESNNQSNNDNNEDESSLFILVFFFVLLFGSLAAGYYFLIYEETTPIKEYKTPYITTPSPDIYKTSPLKNESINTQQVIDSPIATQQAEENIEIIKEESEQKNLPSIMEKEKIAQVKIEDMNSEIIKPVKEYRADIIKQENEITITLHQSPDEDNNTSSEVVTEEPAIKEEVITDDKLTTIKTQPVETPPTEIHAPPARKERVVKEIIHIVVKGDTLWAIAKKYVNNPFLYPELARLSNIKNPHRIYPGNRVRIRFIKK